MKLRNGLGILLLCCCPVSSALAQQGGQAPLSGRAGLGSQQAPPTITSVLQFQLSIVERETEGIAEAMPEDKYNFAPTNGNFVGVRTFAQQVKHIATVNNRFFDSITGATPPAAPDEGIASNGPDALVTKAQIVQYLKDSYAQGHKAIATINADNAVAPLPIPRFPFSTPEWLSPSLPVRTIWTTTVKSSNTSATMAARRRRARSGRLQIRLRHRRSNRTT